MNNIYFCIYSLLVPVNSKQNAKQVYNSFKHNQGQGSRFPMTPAALLF